MMLVDPSQWQWFLNYMLLLLMMNIISVDTSVFSRLFLSTTFCTCRLALLFTSHSLFCLPWYYRLCITIFSLSLSYFHPFQSVVDQWLVQQQTKLKDCCCGLVCWFSFVLNDFNVHFVHFNMETADRGGRKKWMWTEVWTIAQIPRRELWKY